MYLDIKVETWERIHLNEEDGITPEMVVGYLKENQNDPYMLWDMDGLSPETEFLIETEEFLPIERNGGKCTAELFNDYDEKLWDNVDK